MTNVKKFRNHFLTNLLNCHKQSFGKTKPSKYVCIIKFTLPFPQFDPFCFFFLSLHLCCPSFPLLHLWLFHPFHLCPHMQTHPIHLLCLFPSADNLKGRQLLHTTYKMFMTAAGVEGKYAPYRRSERLTRMQHLMS